MCVYGLIYIQVFIYSCFPIDSIYNSSDKHHYIFAVDGKITKNNNIKLKKVGNVLHLNIDSLTERGSYYLRKRTS